jgi:hypothetical protein
MLTRNGWACNPDGHLSRLEVDVATMANDLAAGRVVHLTRYPYKWRVASAITGREQDNEDRSPVAERHHSAPANFPGPEVWVRTGDNRGASIFFHNPGVERKS